MSSESRTGWKHFLFYFDEDESVGGACLVACKALLKDETE